MEEGANTIRILQSRIEAQLKNFEKDRDTIFVKTSFFCDNVRDHILNHEDEPLLSKTHNNHRRIYIALELFNSFCSIYAHIIDNEYAKLIRDLMQWEKYKRISKKITSKMQLEIRREKYFAGEAQNKLLKSSEDARYEETNEDTPTHREERDSETSVVTMHERKSLPAGPEEVEVAIPDQEMNETLAPPPLEGSFRSEAPSNIIGNLTEIRDAVADSTHFELPISPVSRPELSVPNIEAETSIRASNIQQRVDENDISRILQILEDELLPKETMDIQQPKNLEGLASKSPEPVIEETVPENIPPGDGSETVVPQTVPSESSEGWSLPSLEEVENRRRKRRYLIIDTATIIPDYAARAVQLNRNIITERVQAFAGPPSILQAISANHLMTNPGFKNSPFRDVRSSKLSTLYNRHLEVEKKPVEEVLLQRRTVEQREVDISRLRANTAEITEDVGMRAGMHSRFERSDVLVDIPKKVQPADLELTSVVAPPKESLVGVPMSRIMNSTIEPPQEGQLDRINAVPEPAPGVQQLQGKSLERRTSPPWFITTKENPPSDKYRKFNYVHDRLHVYWSMFESQGMEKQISIREFFSFEADGTVADFLTVLRIVDKLSIQRKLLLEYKSGDVVVRPFEIPHVSDAQLLLKEKEPVL